MQQYTNHSYFDEMGAGVRTFRGLVIKIELMVYAECSMSFSWNNIGYLSRMAMMAIVLLLLLFLHLCGAVRPTTSCRTKWKLESCVCRQTFKEIAEELYLALWNFAEWRG